MKLKRLLRNFVCAAALGSLAAGTVACSDDDSNGVGDTGKTGTLSGAVTDNFGQPLAGVTVRVEKTELSTQTADDGTYTLEQAPASGSHIVTFTKEGYQSVSITITEARFTDGVAANLNAEMEYANATIRGTVTDGRNAGAPLAGVTVTLSNQQSATTGDDGAFLFENLALSDYTVTFAKQGYPTETVQITTSDFVDEVATINIEIGGEALIGDLTAYDLRSADKWYYNEYRGGRNAEMYPHWDWACDYMCTLDFRGQWEEQNEGTTLQIHNSTDDQSNPADLENFDSWVFGSKLITEDNCTMTLQIRTHGATAEKPVYYGVQVVDLSAAQPVRETVDDVRTVNSEAYVNSVFDLSKYIGKEIVIGIGIFRPQTGDFYNQLVLRRIAFAKTQIEDGNMWDWLPGTPVAGLDNWKFTEEMVRSTMPHTKKSFTGISKISGSRDNYVDAYRDWRNTGHVAAEWSFVPLHKDPEVFPSEGYLIKTRGSDASVNTREPEAYLYAKFAIGAGQNRLTLKTRTFSDNCTYFKLTAIDESCNATAIAPSEYTATTAEAAADGCWKFANNSGTTSAPNDYATFTYDLSQFDGKDVVLVLGVYKGEANGDESKLCLYSIDLN